MAFDPAASVPGSKAGDWTYFSKSDSKNKNITTYYHPKTKTMVDYDNAKNTFAQVSEGTQRRKAIEAAFKSKITKANDNVTKPPSTPRTTAAGQGAATSTVAPSTSTETKKGGATSVQGYYPLELASTNQDRIKFSKVESGGERSLSTAPGTTSIQKRGTGKSLGEVYLGIQGQISDSNGADWSGMTINPLQLKMAQRSIEQMSKRGESDLLKDLAESAGALAGNVAKDFKRYLAENNREIQILLAQEAIQSQGLLSRLTGKVANPNLELLFNGPTLRPFTFSFRMTPRDDKEAKNVKKIIRFFKTGTAATVVNNEVFVRSPDVFNIQFQSGSKDEPHRSLPRIKTCALIACDVNYTPDGSYMTYNDPNTGYPMTCYEMTLRFSELEPIFSTDYDSIPEDDIGF